MNCQRLARRLRVPRRSCASTTTHQWAEEVRQVKVLVDRRGFEEREAAARAEVEAKQRAERRGRASEEREAQHRRRSRAT